MSSQNQISKLTSEIERLEAQHTQNYKVLEELWSNHCTLKSKLNNSEESRKFLQNQNEFLQEQLDEYSRNTTHTYYEDFCKKKNLELIKTNFDLKNKISELEQFIDSENYSVVLQRKLTEFLECEKEKMLNSNEKNKFETERKHLKSKINTYGLTIKKLSKQVSDFEEIVILERNSTETKCLELSNKVSELQKILDDERTLVENNKKDALKKNALMSEMNKSLENKRKVLDKEIPKLLTKLSDLQSNLVNEKNLRMELKGKYDLLTKERGHLVYKIKELEVELSKQKQMNTETSIFSTSSSIASNSTQKMTPLSPNSVCQNNCSSSVKSNSYSNSSKSYDSSNSRTQNSNRIHNDFVANSGNYKKFRMVWKKKSTTDDSVGNMSHTSTVVDTKSFVKSFYVKNIPKRNSAFRAVKQERVEKGKGAPKSKPRNQRNNSFSFSKTPKNSYFPCTVFSVKQLMNFSRNKICCSNCGVNDFLPLNYFDCNYGYFRNIFHNAYHVNQRFNHKWYGTYSIPTYPHGFSKANLQGPNKAWVPKFVNPFCRNNP